MPLSSQFAPHTSHVAPRTSRHCKYSKNRGQVSWGRSAVPAHPSPVLSPRLVVVPVSCGDRTKLISALLPSLLIVDRESEAPLLVGLRVSCPTSKEIDSSPLPALHPLLDWESLMPSRL